MSLTLDGVPDAAATLRAGPVVGADAAAAPFEHAAPGGRGAPEPAEPAEPAEPEDAEMDAYSRAVSGAVTRVGPSVVNLSVLGEVRTQRGPFEVRGAGSGFVITPD